MSAIPGNLPVNPDQSQSTTDFFNNYFTQSPSVSSGTNDTVIAYFQSITGDVDAGKTLAGAVLYTATQQGIDPVSIVQELKKISDKNLIDVPVITPLTQTVITQYATYQDIVANRTDYDDGQLFYIIELDVFYKLSGGEVSSATGYRADRVILQDETVIYNFSQVSYTAGKYAQRTSANAVDTSVYNNGIWQSSGTQYAKPGPSVAYNSISEINAYLTMFLNLNRSGTSLLGLSNSPLTSKYITRTILA
jgi:hypothetical protein